MLDGVLRDSVQDMPRLLIISYASGKKGVKFMLQSIYNTSMENLILKPSKGVRYSEDTL